MTVLGNVSAFMAVFVGLAPLASAQWPAYPWRRSPRTSTGQPDLSAPAPKAANGKPDLSGIWDNGRNTGGQRGGGARGAAPAAASATSPATGGANAGPPNATFFNVGAGFSEGLPFQQWAGELVKKR